MKNIDSLIVAVKQKYGDATIEQYLFGWAKSYAVIVINAEHTPFIVLEFDNISQLLNKASFDSRVDAAKDLFFRWSIQFVGK